VINPVADRDPIIDLAAIDMLSPEAGWAVGSYGTILHYDGNAWRIESSPTREHITDLAMLNEREGWAVGSGGLILHYVNGEWQEMTSPTTSSILSIDMLNAREGWAVADDLLHYENGEWQSVPLSLDGIFVDLWAIDMVNEQFGWAVGRNNLILRYQNGSWKREKSPVGSDQLLAVSAPTTDEAWASGPSGKLLHYQNGQWQAVDRPGSFGIYSIMMLNEHEGWAVGNGILHYTNK
jgi:photosystem II stability/assembly factor-like uncharacterized protein